MAKQKFKHKFNSLEDLKKLKELDSETQFDDEIINSPTLLGVIPGYQNLGIVVFVTEKELKTL